MEKKHNASHGGRSKGIGRYGNKLDGLLEKSSAWTKEKFTAVPMNIGIEIDIALEEEALEEALEEEALEESPGSKRVEAGATPTNKRARRDSDLDAFKQLHNYLLPPADEQTKLSPKPRCHSEDREDEEWMRQARRIKPALFDEKKVPRTAKHDAAAKRSGKSPGQTVLQRSSSDIIPNMVVADHPSSSSTVEPEIGDREDIYSLEQKAGKGRPDIVIQSTSVKSIRNKQHSSAVYPPLSGHLRKPPCASRSLLTAFRDESSSISGHARGQTTSNNERNAARVRKAIWAPLERYWDSRQSSFPKYRYSSDSGLVVEENGAKIPGFSPPRPNTLGTPTPKPGRETEEGQNMPVPNGGPKPTNRLGGVDKANPSLPPKKKEPSKFYDLHGDHYGHNEHPSKKRKVGAASDTKTKKEFIDVDENESTSQSKNDKGTSTARSIQSQTQNGSRSGNGGVEEYKRVDDYMKPQKRSRDRNTSSSGGKKLGGPNSYVKPQSQKQTVVRLDEVIRNPLENFNDPISDSSDELEIGTAQSIANIPPPSSRKSHPVVEISSSATAETGSDYKGSAKLHPSRPEAKGLLNSSAGLSRGLPPSQNPQGRQRKQTSINSDPRASTQGNARKLRTSMEIEHTETIQNEKLDPDQSVDPLSIDYFTRDPDVQTAGDLLVSQSLLSGRDEERRRKSVSQTGREGSDLQSAMNVSSDEDTLRKHDIKRTPFHSRKGNGKKKTPDPELYNLVFACSPVQRWLTETNLECWTLRHDLEKEALICQREGTPIWELPISKVEKLRVGLNSPILIIHKSRDPTFGKAIHIMLQFSHADEATRLRDALGVEYMTKNSDELMKIITKARLQPERVPRKQQPSGDEEVEALTKLSERREAERRMKQQRAGQQANNPLVDPPKSQGLRKLLEASASEEQQTDATKSRYFTRSEDPSSGRSGPSEITTGNFYGKSSLPHPETTSQTTRSSTRAAKGTSKPRPPPRPRTPSPDRYTVEHPEWGQHWKKSISYHRATVDKGDIPRLDEGEFLNDNLIAFYLRWLEQKLAQEHPELTKRIYFNNTFFYSRLTNTQGRSKRNINYEAVERWTAKVNLLTYDYIIVPVCENTHWYVAIIYNAPKLVDSEVDPKGQQEQPSPTHAPTSKEQLNENSLDVQDSEVSPKMSPTKSDAEVDNGVKRLSLTDNNGNPEEIQGNEKPHDHDRNQGEYSGFGTEENIYTSSKVDGFEKKENIETKDELHSDSREPSPPLVVSDLLQSTPPTTSRTSSQTKKGKRKSIPAPRKHDPNAPRIITFDSLGMSHSPTCTNLKNYLIAEIKSKLKMDIPDPGGLGMTAKHIPQQDNYCDCGLFLLGYIETFLQKPDEFIHGILQNSEDLEIKWPKAPDMRNKIRRILFDLQGEEMAEFGKQAALKDKKKTTSKVDGKKGRAAASSSASREASKSTRSSPQPQQASENRIRKAPRTTPGANKKTFGGTSNPRGASGFESRAHSLSEQTDRAENSLASNAKPSGMSGPPESNENKTLKDRDFNSQEDPGQSKSIFQKVFGFIRGSPKPRTEEPIVPSNSEVVDSQDSTCTGHNSLPIDISSSNAKHLLDPVDHEEDNTFYTLDESHQTAANDNKWQHQDFLDQFLNSTKRNLRSPRPKPEHSSRVPVGMGEDERNHIDLSKDDEDEVDRISDQNWHAESPEIADSQDDNEMLLQSGKPTKFQHGTRPAFFIPNTNTKYYEPQLDSPPSAPSLIHSSPSRKARTGVEVFSSPRTENQVDGIVDLASSSGQGKPDNQIGFASNALPSPRQRQLRDTLEHDKVKHNLVDLTSPSRPVKRKASSDLRAESRSAKQMFLDPMDRGVLGRHQNSNPKGIKVPVPPQQNHIRFSP